MKPCPYCQLLVDEERPGTFKEVVSWVSGPKLDGPVLREQTGRVAHEECIRKRVAGQAPDQLELFPEEG